MNRARRVLISLAAALVLVGVVAALVLALRPLPTLSGWGGGWCGPGSKSSNALQVWLNPDIVNPDTGEFHDLILKDFCVGEANNRMMEAALGLMAGLLLGGAVMFAPLITGRSGTPVARRVWEDVVLAWVGCASCSSWSTDQMTSQSRVGSPAATVRATGNLALLVCGILLLLDLLAPRGQVELASVILVIAGVGLRIEAAISDRTTGD